MNALVLFDVDQTLVETARAGRDALDETFAELFGVTGAFRDAPLAGRTDRGILLAGLARHRIAPGDPRVAGFFPRYLERLELNLADRAGRLRVLPGVEPLLDRLAAAGHRLGLLTGNIRAGARLKLERLGLARRFPDGGAFGDEEARREPLLPRALAALGWTGGPARVLVVGDTPGDIACARAGGARAAAVATGPYSRAELAAHRPDLALDSLVDAQPILSLLNGKDRR